MWVSGDHKWVSVGFMNILLTLLYLTFTDEGPHWNRDDWKKDEVIATGMGHTDFVSVEGKQQS